MILFNKSQYNECSSLDIDLLMQWHRNEHTVITIYADFTFQYSFN